MMKWVEKLFNVGHRQEEKEKLEDDLTKDRALQREINARLKALDVVVEVQTRGLQRRDNNPHNQSS